MIYEIYTDNGTKKKRALTGNGYGLPLGSIIAVYSNLVPDGYLPCNGAVYDTTTYAALYAYLGSNRLPDLRECNLVGAGQSSNDYDASTNPNGIHEHDVYNVGEFKDDQLQGHEHLIPDPNYSTKRNGGDSNTQQVNPPFNTKTKGIVDDGTNGTPRVGTTTHGKQVGVNYCIKATPAYVEPDTVSAMVNTLRTQDSYSTSEVNTGKKWIDGKPIYRKVITIVASSSGSWTSTEVFSNINLVSIYGTCTRSDISTQYPIPWPSESSRNDIMTLTLNTDGKVEIRKGSNWANISTTNKIVVEYTKTTD